VIENGAAEFLMGESGQLTAAPTTLLAVRIIWFWLLPPARGSVLLAAG
jgi:hypothetical protein